MALSVFRLTGGGLTTLDLLGGSLVRLIEYVPTSPQQSGLETSYAAHGADGGELTGVTRQNVAEQCRLLILSTTPSATVQALERFFRRAEEYQTLRAGAPVYIEAQTAADTETWRSELLTGRVELAPNTLEEGMAAGAVEVAVAWSRRFYWEGYYREASLWNSSVASPAQGGLTIWNHDDADAGHDDWVQIAGSAIPGVLPTPADIILTRTDALSPQMGAVYYIGQGTWGDVANAPHLLEGEVAAWPIGGDVADASCSGGKARTTTWGTAPNEARLMSWTLGAGDLAALGGRPYRLLLRVRSDVGYGVRRLRAAVYPPSATWLALSETTPITVPNIVGGFFCEVGTLRLAPQALTSPAPLTLSLYGSRETAGQLAIDFLALMPADGWRVLASYSEGVGLEPGEMLYDQPSTGHLYAHMPGVGDLGYFTAWGAPIMLWPGRTQRLYFQVEDNLDWHRIAMTHTVRVWFAPRRLTI